MDTTTINRILAANAKTRELYLGCFPCDKLPNIINKYPSALVANNDPSNKEDLGYVTTIWHPASRHMSPHPSNRLSICAQMTPACARMTTEGAQVARASAQMARRRFPPNS
ncbi:hypothetical protein niasHT_028299 [Heterodera trifolii]|uniref:Uncharacterized protein n=1 Tax=Heterodera trifolii TaxID=157864 RepID=A0ABD2JVC3_9BILA